MATNGSYSTLLISFVIVFFISTSSAQLQQVSKISDLKFGQPASDSLFTAPNEDDFTGSYQNKSSVTPTTAVSSATTPPITTPATSVDTGITELIIIIAVPTVSLTIICVVCTVFGYKKAKLRGQKWLIQYGNHIFGSKENEYEEHVPKLQANNMMAAMNNYMDIKAMAEKYKKDKWEIANKNLMVHDNDCLGNGAFANVYKGTLKGTIPLFKVYSSLKLVLEHTTADNCEVAVKKLPPHASEDSKIDFFNEMMFMKQLGYHAHVISMLGCVSNPLEPLIVVEYCKNGDLLRFLRKHRSYYLKADDDDCPIEADYCLRAKDLVSIAWQISDGLCYLTSHNFIHRDVAARNVLLTQSLVAKISDFGLCRYADSSLYTAKGGRLPIKWMAPESLKYYTYTAKTDVWSFSILLFELFSFGEAPFGSIQPLEMVDTLERGDRLKQPSRCPNEIYNLMKNCWEFNPDDRPTFEEIRGTLTLMLNMNDEQYGYLDLGSDLYGEITTRSPTTLTYLDEEESGVVPRSSSSQVVNAELQEPKKVKKGKIPGEKFHINVEVEGNNEKALVDRKLMERLKELTTDCEDIEINIIQSRPPTPGHQSPSGERLQCPMTVENTLMETKKALERMESVNFTV